MARGRKTGGRNKGTPNKLSSTVRAIELMAAAEVIGSGSKEKAFIALYRWAWKALNDKRLAPDTKQKNLADSCRTTWREAASVIEGG